MGVTTMALDWLTVAAGILVRSCDAAVEFSMTLLVGLVVAGIMRSMLGTVGIRALFAGAGIRGLARAWAVGMVLPVCSLGVIPIARELLRARVPSGTVLAFILAAPHINPISLLYGLTLSSPMVIVCYGLASLGLAIGGGALWERFFNRDHYGGDALPPAEPSPPPGAGRLLAVALVAARGSVGLVAALALASALFNGLVAGLLPHGILGMTMRHDDWRSPALMAAVATPFYTGPLQGMMRIGLIFEHGNSSGAGFVLFELGIGVNLALLAWLAIRLGAARLAAWLAILLAAVVASGYAMEQPLYFAHEEASHTHAFDDWTNPFVPGDRPGLAAILGKVAAKCGAMEAVSLVALAVLSAVGIVARITDPREAAEAWLAMPARRPSGMLSADVPPRVLGVVAMAVLVAFSIVSLYTYYPPHSEVLEEMVMVKTEALSAVMAGNKQEAVRQLEALDLLTRKLQVGIFIRTGRNDPETARMADEFRERVEEMRDLLIAGDNLGAREMISRVDSASRSLRTGLHHPAADSKTGK
ncbi:MAG: hypothetical protein FJ261_00675 [Planctomycetes bacterium]|nr:hypothetical protein [Planctomycetota bacterium]